MLKEWSYAGVAAAPTAGDALKNEKICKTANRWWFNINTSWFKNVHSFPFNFVFSEFLLVYYKFMHIYVLIFFSLFNQQLLYHHLHPVRYPATHRSKQWSLRQVCSFFPGRRAVGRTDANASAHYLLHFHRLSLPAKYPPRNIWFQPSGVSVSWSNQRNGVIGNSVRQLKVFSWSYEKKFNLN